MRNKVHPAVCRCSRCKKNNKDSNKESGFIGRTLFLMVIFLVVCF